jgi:hypothetical protein
MATRSDVIGMMRQIVDRKNTGSLEVTSRDRGLYRSPESGKPVSLAGKTLYSLGLFMPDWKRNADLMGDFQYEGLTAAAKKVMREAQELERSGIRWRVIVDRLETQYS